MSEVILSKWHQEMDIFRKIKPCLIMEGNILDSYMYPLEGSLPQGSIVRLTDYLHYYFKDIGYENIVMYDGIRGFYNKCEDGYIQKFADLVNVSIAGNRSIIAEFRGKGTGSAALMVETALIQNESPTVVIMDFASRYICDPSHLTQPEIDGFTILMQASLDAQEVKTENGILKNLVILLVNKLNDVPAWYYLDNPNVKAILLKTPSKEERIQMVKGVNFKAFFTNKIYQEDYPYYENHPDELEKIQDRFIGLTEGFTFTELNGLRRLCKNQGIRINDLCSIIDLYKFGIKENPWNKLNPDDFKDAYADFEKRVKGQPNALTQTLDVIKRAMTGMADISASTHGKPKGVLFFAGPTGTGKTETAKTIAEKLFGDESACIRFDMSEFGQSHSDQRLLGAPPGYVGYEAGGQLTNAVKNNPFSILLFDEIEKAHPSILDKFLQILEDGRMTDGKGETVYFSETVIIFTSNLGIYERGQNGERIQMVSSDMSYDEVKKTVRQGIDNYFKLQLGRPEILNRIGENIVVFDFIRPEIAEKILKAQLDKIVVNLHTNKKVELTITNRAFNVLKNKALNNLENGGRGIGNIVESCFVNPLSRYMFDNKLLNNCQITIEDIQAESMPYSIIAT
ncbi:AAA family ATPase [Aristaeella lactis]|uniref:C-terminal, D2-small domain-containing protein, of ClpB protein n=1 Tax=Aristaeella lactis TaxID=3046383 RepID=A0AC61PLJ1_9FIRM|nr:AAA family ATPase [Aristaeella lactis]QUA54667.1 ATP-dependent Clp protease ATP-binding subunit [Aristaeella lactis]SMC63587.1 C-terminal, D2-small domain-containing protein, of ClpB protein [Aristaeella lactis]